MTELFDKGPTKSRLRDDEYFVLGEAYANDKRPVWFPAFLELLALHGSVTNACKQLSESGANTRTILRWKKNSPAFAAEFKEARDIAGERMRDEAYRRAVEGTEEPIFQGGKRVGTITRYSDTLLIFLLKQHDPSFRDRSYNLNVNLSPDEVKNLTEEEITAELKKRGVLTIDE